MLSYCSSLNAGKCLYKALKESQCFVCFRWLCKSFGSNDALVVSAIRESTAVDTISSKSTAISLILRVYLFGNDDSVVQSPMMFQRK